MKINTQAYIAEQNHAVSVLRSMLDLLSVENFHQRWSFVLCREAALE
jgi:hypothetical protein